MDKRFFLAIALALGVLFLTPKLFPPAPVRITTTADTTAAPSNAGAPAGVTSAPVPASGPPLRTATGPFGAAPAGTAAVVAETAAVVTARATFRFSNAGGSLIGAEMADYTVLPARNRQVELARRGWPLVSYRIIVDRDSARHDTVDLARYALRTMADAKSVHYEGSTPLGALSLNYSFVADSYVVRVSGTLKGTGGERTRLGVVLPQGLGSYEADTIDDHNNLAFVVKGVSADAESEKFSKVAKSGLVAIGGPFSWVASKNKYFLLAVLAPPKGAFAGPAVFTSTDTAKVPSAATGEVIIAPDSAGAFSFDIYAGPQQWRRLVALGRDLEHANPYGGFMRTVVQPFATIVMRILLWMHDTFKLNYGWVLVIFGVAVRLILWPLNQSAMRSSLRMQRIQPELQALQAKYKANPEKMQAEYMKLLKDHGMTPFSQFSGCLPMLIPMPVLFALFFVFQNTIEFRGVSFFWMADISLKDPYYILPVVMGASMFLLSWIGMRNAPPNPQAKMLGYMMPGMMVVLFLRFAAGLNLYYAVQNFAALPQQWLIAKERAKKPAT